MAWHSAGHVQDTSKSKAMDTIITDYRSYWNWNTKFDQFVRVGIAYALKNRELTDYIFDFGMTETSWAGSGPDQALKLAF